MLNLQKIGDAIQTFASLEPVPVRKTLSRLLTEAASSRRSFVAPLLFSALSAASAVAAFYLTGLAADLSGVEAAGGDLVRMTLFAAAALLFAVCMRVIGYRLETKPFEYMIAAVKDRVDSALGNEEARSGRIAAEIQNDLGAVDRVLPQMMGQIVRLAAIFCLSLVTLLFLSPSLTLLVLLPIPILCGCMIALSKLTQKQHQAATKARDELSARTQNMCAYHTVIKAYSQEKKAAMRIEDANISLYHREWRERFYLSLALPIALFLFCIGFVLVVMMGSAVPSAFGMRLGAFLPFLLCLGYLYLPVLRICSILGGAHTCIAALARLFSLIDKNKLAEE